jgi:hypothetical protein
MAMRWKSVRHSWIRLHCVAFARGGAGDTSAGFVSAGVDVAGVGAAGVGAAGVGVDAEGTAGPVGIGVAGGSAMRSIISGITLGFSSVAIWNRSVLG